MKRATTEDTKFGFRKMRRILPDDQCSVFSASSVLESCSVVREFVSEPTHIATRAASLWNVGVEHVVHHHPIGTEAPPERANGAFHARNPFSGQAVLIALVVLGNHLVAQD